MSKTNEKKDLKSVNLRISTYINHPNIINTAKNEFESTGISF